MPNIADLFEAGSLGPKDFSLGERVRIFLRYRHSSSDIQVREGIVVNPEHNKRGYLSSHYLALQIDVEKIGQLKNGSPQLEDHSPNISSFFYRHIGFVERP